MNIAYTIYKAAPTIDGRHEILRKGACPENKIGKQVREGESIWVGEALCDVENFIAHDADGRKLVCRHTDEDIARRAPPGWQPKLERVAADLAAKGMNPTLARRLAQRRLDRARVEQDANNVAAKKAKSGA